MDRVALYYVAMWVSEIWYANWRATGSLYAKTRGLIIHDRIMTGREPRPRN